MAASGDWASYTAAYPTRRLNVIDELEPDIPAPSPSSVRRTRETLWVDLNERASGTFASQNFLKFLVRQEHSAETGFRGLATAPGSGGGSMQSSVFTLVASAMGAGCLSLPHMFRQSGLALGIILLVCGALLAHVSLVVLMSCARYTGMRSLAEIVALSYSADSCLKTPGRRRTELFVNGVVALFGIAAVLVYMMLIGDFFGGIAESGIFGQSAAEVPRGLLLLLSLTVLLPLSLPRNISALRHVCVLSTSAIGFLTLVVLLKMPALYAAAKSATGEGIEASGIVWFAGDACTTLRSFAVSVFAFTAHTNAVPVVNALDDPRAARIWKASLISVLIELTMYVLIGTAGYLSFLETTKQDFIRNYPADDAMILLVRCIYTMPVLFGAPINLAPAASSLQELTREALGWASNRDGGMTLHAIIVTAVLGSCAFIAVYCEAFADIVSLFGSFFGTLVSLYWPLQVYWGVLSDLHSRTLRWMVQGLLMGATALGTLTFLLQVSGC